MIKSDQGYTIIELLVVIIIISLLVGMGISSYNGFNRRQTLKQLAKTLKNDLRLVQSKALSGEKDCSLGVCGGVLAGCGNDSSEKSLDGWRISFLADSYEIAGYCQGTKFGTKTVFLPSGVSWTLNPLSPTYVQFNPLALGVSQQKTITLSAEGRNEVTTITLSGEIK